MSGSSLSVAACDSKDYDVGSAPFTTSVTVLLGHATTGIGLIPRKPCKLKRLCWVGQCTAASGSPTLTLTVYKNASSGSGARVFEVAQALVNGTGYAPATSTVLNSLDAFNGTTDYFTLTGQVTSGTSTTITNFSARVEWEYDQ